MEELEQRLTFALENTSGLYVPHVISRLVPHTFLTPVHCILQRSRVNAGYGLVAYPRRLRNMSFHEVTPFSDRPSGTPAVSNAIVLALLGLSLIWYETTFVVAV